MLYIGENIMAKKKRRKLSKVQAKEQALRQRQTRRRNWTIAGVAAVIALVVLILYTLTGGKDIKSLRDDVETGLTEKGYPYRGAADAPVTIVEFSDYKCGHCRDFALEAAPIIDDEFVASGQVKYVVQPFALWENSLPIVEAAACARDQGSFWEFHHQAFANQNLFVPQPPERSVLRKLAQGSGLDIDEFDACLDEGRHAEDVLASTEDGKLEWDVNSTPTFFVNGVLTQLSGEQSHADTMRQAVQAALAAQGE
jgi:protein-disulfide isomerase